MKKIRRQAVILAALLALAAAPAMAQAPAGASNLAELRKSAPKVFLDCQECDIDYIRTEIPFVNYVRDRKEAAVHVLITTQDTGSGGEEYTLAFIGLGSCAGLDNKLVYASRTTDTEEEVRRGYVAVLKMGLIPYAARTPIRDLIAVQFKEKVKPTDVVDPWKFWVFSLSLYGELDQETQKTSESVMLLVTANKITPDFKVRLGAYGNFNREAYDYEDTTIQSDSKSSQMAGLIVKSLGEHWSAGVYLDATSSTYSNLSSKITPQAAVEYDFFPYSESTRRQLRVLYRVGPELTRYREETIYGKTRETLVSQSLSATLEVIEPWGSLSAGLEGSHYFHDFSKNRLQFETELSFRIFKGLEFNVDAYYERIRDQLSLPKGGASLEEVLMEIRELATDYNLGVEIGLSYTFGSIYSNVVNPRFGSLGTVGHDQY
ncbi:MAG: hypothetical protein PHI34_02725 [Acidobacteriota bacterium]|nr:hypothetical protein [Acidobacteriota bacterium]